MQDDNGAVTYELNADAAGLVRIDGRTGAVTAVGSLNHEVTPQITFHVLAVDQGADKKFSSALVNLHVNNTDDEPPRFEKKW